MPTYLNHIRTTKSITLIFDEGDPVNILDSDPLFNIVSKALSLHDYKKIVDVLNDKKNILKYTTLGKFSLDSDKNIVINGKVIPRAISDKIIKFVNLSIDTTPLEKFWENLEKNPSHESQHDLFIFLEKNHIPITEDGYFIAYRSVKENFTDHHTGTMDNSVGSIVKMDRNLVNADRNTACAPGLHVAAYRYLPTMGQGVIVEVKVNPKNVVSVPIDHEMQKMRVCEFEILSVHNGDELDDELYKHKKAEAKELNIMSVKKKGNTAVLSEKQKTTFVLKPDSAGRVRVPWELLKKLNATDAVIFAAVRNTRSRNVALSKKNFKGAYLVKTYQVHEGSIKLSPSIFQEAKIAWSGTYDAKLVDGIIEIRQTKSSN